MAVEENPAISAALVKLETIEAGAQVNPDLTPLSEAIDTHRVNFNNPHQTTKEQAGVNFITGTINMVNNKKAIINFNMAFTKTPRISLTLLDNAQAPAYTTNVNKTGFQINMPINYTGAIEWIALERE